MLGYTADKIGMVHMMHCNNQLGTIEFPDSKFHLNKIPYILKSSAVTNPTFTMRAGYFPRETFSPNCHAQCILCVARETKSEWSMQKRLISMATARLSNLAFLPLESKELHHGFPITVFIFTIAFYLRLQGVNLLFSYLLACLGFPHF